MSPQDPLLDFAPETTVVCEEPIPVSAPFSMTQPPTYAIDTTSRVISFVLGFALASLIAWVGSISGENVAATGNGKPVAAAGTPVVAAAKEEKKPVTRAEPKTSPMSPPKATTVAAPTPAAPRTPAPAPVAVVSSSVLATAASPPAIRPARNAPARTVEPVSSEARAQQPGGSSGFRGGLSLSSDPAGAQVVLNGKVVGQTPVVLKDLPVGSRALVVRRDGYSPWSASVRIVADQVTTIRATLVPAPQSGG